MRRLLGSNPRCPNQAPKTPLVGRIEKQVVPKAAGGGVICKEHFQFQALIETVYPRNPFLKVRERYSLGLLLWDRLSVRWLPRTPSIPVCSFAPG